jgi:hypothetical protein
LASSFIFFSKNPLSLLAHSVILKSVAINFTEKLLFFWTMLPCDWGLSLSRRRNWSSTRGKFPRTFEVINTNHFEEKIHAIKLLPQTFFKIFNHLLFEKCSSKIRSGWGIRRDFVWELSEFQTPFLRICLNVQFYDFFLYVHKQTVMRFFPLKKIPRKSLEVACLDHQRQIFLPFPFVSRKHEFHMNLATEES